jgi:cell division protein YceG involved in septum cleavage
MITIPDGKNILAIGQILLDLIVLCIFFSLYRRLKMLDVQKIERIIDVLKKSEELSHQLEKTLKKNEALSDSLTVVLNKKSSNNDLKTGYNPANKNMLHNQVIALWKTGKSVLDIAEFTGLSPGEVEIIISLAKTSGKN